jgi:hypothetical protein
MKRLIIVLMLVSLVGCATKIAPVNLKWPDAPAELLAPAEELTPLTVDQTQLSDLLNNANTNFSKYYILKDRYDAWQSWYNSHKQIYQGAQ